MKIKFKNTDVFYSKIFIKNIFYKIIDRFFNIKIIFLSFNIIIFSILNISFSVADANLRIAALKFGTANWELNTIRHHKFDRENGFTLVIQPIASTAAGKIMFEGGETDAIIADWIWVARRRAAGGDHVFTPYSRAVGGLMVAMDSPVADIRDLSGKMIGVAGGTLDKSWLIFQAYALQEGFDLKTESQQAFGAPPLIFQKALSGETDGVINFWRFLAKLEARGFRTVLSVADAAHALGLNPETPLLGYVFHEAFVRANQSIVDGFIRASREAKRLLATDDREWDRLRPMMKAGTDAEFERLKSGFRAGIPDAGPIDYLAAERMLSIMAKMGGSELVGDATRLPNGVFLNDPDFGQTQFN